jgi:hypothetical protein
MNNNRLFHWTPSLNKKLNSINPDIQPDQNTDTNPDPDKINNTNFYINNTPSNLPSNLSTNSQSLIKSKATGSIKNISSVFKRVTISFLELTQIKFINLLFLNLQLRSINSILCQYTSYPKSIYYMLEKVGKELGQLNFEYQLRKGYFISNKVYALLLNDGTIIKKGKGFSSDSVSLSEYEQMYLYSHSIKANKIYGITNYSLRSLFIDNKKIIID